MDTYRLAVAGVNVAGGITRFRGNTQMYEACLLRFPEDENYRLLCEAFSGKDAKAAFDAAHALKGLAGNLSMDKLCQELFPLVETLRAGSLANAEEQLIRVSRDYRAVVSALRE